MDGDTLPGGVIPSGEAGRELQVVEVGAYLCAGCGKVMLMDVLSPSFGLCADCEQRAMVGVCRNEWV